MLIPELARAIADAHSPRTLVCALADVLGSHAKLTRVELRAPLPVAVAERAEGTWRSVDGPSTRRAAQPVAPGLAVVATGALPAVLAEPEVRDAIGALLEMASRHLEVVGRVAQLSRRAHVANRELRAELDRPGARIVANSPAMRAALARASQVARHATTVLITGESGTGKEVIAREIHRRSPRAHRSMVQLNCAAIPDALIESELFGHERGAFTGAERAHAGVFERADRSTLLLDEVGELSAAAQAKLLRVIQEGRIRRVGGEAEIAVDVRLIAATHRSLAAMVEAGTFREDLWYRLDVLAIEVPPLRERREDLAPLTHAIARELAEQLGTHAAPAVPRTMLAKLAAHDWPGNVRELRNVLEAALVLGGGTAFELAADFPRRRGGGRRTPRVFDAAMRAAIEDALRVTRGKIYGAGGAAALLGLEPSTLQSKMQKLGIARARFV